MHIYLFFKHYFIEITVNNNNENNKRKQTKNKKKTPINNTFESKNNDKQINFWKNSSYLVIQR